MIRYPQDKQMINESHHDPYPAILFIPYISKYDAAIAAIQRINRFIILKSPQKHPDKYREPHISTQYTAPLHYLMSGAKAPDCFYHLQCPHLRQLSLSCRLLSAIGIGKAFFQKSSAYVLSSVPEKIMNCFILL